MDIAYTVALGLLVGEDIVVNFTHFDGFRAVEVYSSEPDGQWTVRFDLPGEGTPFPEELIPHIHRARAEREAWLASL